MKAWTLLIISMVMLASAFPDEKKVDWPDTTGARWAKAFFHAYNIEGDKALEQFVKKNYSAEFLKNNSVEREVAGIRQLRGLTGGLEVHSVSADGEYSIDAVVKTKNLGWVKFRVWLSHDPPHDPSQIGPVGTVSPPEEEEKGAYVDWENLVDLLEQVRSDAGMPALAAAVVRNGKIVEKEVIGVRSLDQPHEARLDDRFQLGSVTKLITATMIGRLVEARVLRWEMTIGEILAEIPMRKEYREVTLDQLLRFHGGLPNVPSGGVFAEVCRIDFKPDRSPAEGRVAHVRQALSEEPAGDPDEKRYSSAAYVVAGYMAERVAKRSWEELMRRRIFEPLGMKNTGFGWPATIGRPDQPLGHYGSPPNLKAQKIDQDPFGLHTFIGPAGDIQCSIEDLARYAAFHLDAFKGESDLIRPGTIRRFFDARKTDEGVRRICFFGSGGTFFSMIALYPDSDLGVVAATNCGLHAWKYMEKLRDAVHERMKPGKR